MKITKIATHKILEKYIITFSLILFTIFQSCNNSDTKVKELEKTVADLKLQVAAQDAKIETEKTFRKINTNSAFLSPWERFLLQEWEVIDVGYSECIKRCSSDNSAGYKICIKKYPEGQDRIDCINAILKESGACMSNCGRRFPPSF
jgi:hypothetical protein